MRRGGSPAASDSPTGVKGSLSSWWVWSARLGTTRGAPWALSRAGGATLRASGQEYLSYCEPTFHSTPVRLLVARPGGTIKQEVRRHTQYTKEAKTAIILTPRRAVW